MTQAVSAPNSAVRPSWTVLADGLDFPEGPAFDAHGALWFVELKAGVIARRDAAGLTLFEVGGRPNGIAFVGFDLLYCDAEHDTVRRLIGRDPADARTEIFAAHPGLRGPNDLAADSSGGVVFTCPGNSRREPTGKVWRRAPDGSVALVAEGLFFPNGLAFTPAGDALVVAETYRHRLWRGGWADGRWIDPRPWVEVGGPIGPDGMAFGPDGLLYVAVYGRGCVVAVNDDGEIVRGLTTPGANPTNVAFDPSGRLGLVVTEAEQGALLSLSGWRDAA